jgi:CRISPR-associated protein Csy3
MAKKIPSALSFETGMLAFSRSLQITEGLFFGVEKREGEDIRVPIEILEKGVRGQTSQDNAKDKAGLSNPQSVEFAVVPQGCSAVTLAFGLRVLPMSRQPHACDDTNVGDAYRRLATAYDKAQGYDVLATLYIWNIANGRFAWRNRFQADDMSVTVEFDGRSIAFDPRVLGFDDMPDRDELIAAITVGGSQDLDALITGVARGLTDTAFTAKVSWTAIMDPGQEIFPSQEYVRSEKVDDKLSRVLAKLPTMWRGRQIQQASMHSQKIGAALRHIDVWHGTDGYGAIAVNPYGGVQETSAVLRAPGTKKSFYDLRKNADAILEAIELATTPDSIPKDIHFIMANLVRGGVLGQVKGKGGADS